MVVELLLERFFFVPLFAILNVRNLLLQALTPLPAHLVNLVFLHQSKQLSKTIMPSSDTQSSVGSRSSTNSFASFISQTSTVEFEHEPFDQYVSKVQQLCQDLWPLAMEGFTIERLRGGSFNRIIGITFLSSTSNKEESFILRIPRFDEGQQEQEVAILRYVGEHTSLPVVDVVFADCTNTNPLGSPYVIQSRLAGNILFDTYQSLAHQQQRSVVSQFAIILLDQQNVVKRISDIVEAAVSDTGTYEFNVGRFHIDPEPDLDLETELSPETVRALDMFLTLFKLQEASTLQHFPKTTLKAALY